MNGRFDCKSFQQASPGHMYGRSTHAFLRIKINPRKCLRLLTHEIRKLQKDSS